MKNFFKCTIDGILAGIMIIIGCSVFLSCENKYVGAFFFSVALIVICFKGFSLFTGKIGYLIDNHDKDSLTNLLAGLLGNTIATFLFGLLIGLALPNLKETAATICSNKLALDFVQVLIRAIFCGILMYVAVSVYKEKNSIVGILFCIPVFILSGFEHSIADMGYFAIGGVISLDAFIFIMIVILGNTIGGLMFPALKWLSKEIKK